MSAFDLCPRHWILRSEWCWIPLITQDWCWHDEPLLLSDESYLWFIWLPYTWVGAVFYPACGCTTTYICMHSSVLREQLEIDFPQMLFLKKIEDGWMEYVMIKTPSLFCLSAEERQHPLHLGCGRWREGGADHWRCIAVWRPVAHITAGQE